MAIHKAFIDAVLLLDFIVLIHSAIVEPVVITSSKSKTFLFSKFIGFLKEKVSITFKALSFLSSKL